MPCAFPTGDFDKGSDLQVPAGTSDVYDLVLLAQDVDPITQVSVARHCFSSSVHAVPIRGLPGYFAFSMPTLQYILNPGQGVSRAVPVRSGEKVRD